MKVEITWKPLTKAGKIESRIMVAFFWLMVPFSALNSVRRFGVTWPAIEWALIALLTAVLMTGLIFRVERAQREQNPEVDL